MNKRAGEATDIGGPTWDDSHTRFRNGFPLFLLGGSCVLLAVFLQQDGSVLASIHAAIWLLFLSIGIIALAAGAVAIVAGQFDVRTGESAPKVLGDPPSTPEVRSQMFGGPGEEDERVASLSRSGSRGS